jgi:hypothetical protein
LEGLTQASGFLESGEKIPTGVRIDANPHRLIGRMIVDAGLGDRLIQGFFQHQSVGNHLEAIPGPRNRLIILIVCGATAFVLIRDDRPIVTTQAIDPSDQAELLTGQLTGQPLSCFLRVFQGCVQMSA